MNHTAYLLLAGAFLNVFMCGATVASNEVEPEDDGHGDLHRPNNQVAVPQKDDGHGDIHRDPVGPKFRSHL